MRTYTENTEEHGELTITIEYNGSVWVVKAVDQDGEVIEWTSFTSYPSQWDIDAVFMF